MTSRTFLIFFTGMMFLSFGLAGVNWLTTPEKSGAWLASIGFMVFVRVFIGFLLRARPLARFSDQERRFFVVSVFLAGGMIIVSLTQHLPIFSGTETGKPMSRVTGAVFGLLLAVVGNFIPKVLRPLSRSDTAHSVCQSPVRRFSGTVFFVTGLSYMASWLVLPQAYAGDVATVICLCGTVLVLTRFVWASRPWTS